jgi:hypothetical protein
MDDANAGVLAALISYPILFYTGNRLKAAVLATGGKRYGFIALSILLLFFGLVCCSIAAVNAGGSGAFLSAIGIIAIFVGWTKKEADEETEGERLDSEGMGWTSTAPPAVKPKAKRKAKPKAKPKADTYDWDNYYEQLIELDGCGPKTAQIIISKVQSERELTDREHAFWDQIS